jgi:hypothetical protein
MSTSDREPWYRAGKEDDYSIKKKILRDGCRDVYREVVECKNDRSKSVSQCELVTKDYDECMKIYKYLIAKK